MNRFATAATRASGQIRSEAAHRSRCLRIKKVLAFIRSNGSATSEEVFKATGLGTGCAEKYLIRRKLDGVWKYTVRPISSVKV